MRKNNKMNQLKIAKNKMKTKSVIHPNWAPQDSSLAVPANISDFELINVVHTGKNNKNRKIH